MKPVISISVISALLFLSFSVKAQTYTLVWEDTFDGNRVDPAKWNIEENVGIWNTGGNRELQHYRKENVQAGDDGQGNNCLILTAKKEDYKGYSFTSGRVNTKGKFAFTRGKLEAMIKIPDLANGLWPAFWTLGYTPAGWPDCGEIDVLEMGHAAGIAAGAQNRYIGSHLFWGPYPRDYGNNFIAPQDLSSGYFKHTVIWNETKISVYFNDSSQPYFTMGITGDETEEFRNYPHYILFNLAVGGSVPGINTAIGITAPLPASMYIDWVKVYQETGKEDFGAGELPLFGSYGIFEEKANTDMRLKKDYDLQVETSGVAPNENEIPLYGNEVLSYNLQAGQPFSIDFRSILPRNMENYANGSIQFYIKTDMQSPLKIGLGDSSGGISQLTFSEQTERNILRDNTWQPVSITLSDLQPITGFSAIEKMLFIEGVSTGNATLSIDEIFYSETIPAKGIFGIYTNNPAITEKLSIDNVTGHLYNWDNTVAFNTALPAYEGTDVLSFRSQGGAGWWGWGIFSDQALNLTNFNNGYLHFALNTSSAELFRVTVNGANNTKGEVTFQNGNDPYGFQRDGRWHQLVIPMADLVAKGLDLSACGNIFTMSGGTIAGIAVDDVYLSESPDPVENLMVNAIGSPVLMPDYLTMNYAKASKLLTVSGFRGGEIVSVWNTAGQRIHYLQPKDYSIQLNLRGEHSPFCLIRVLSAEGMWIRKISIY